ncbi:uncharacterized protein LOC108733827 isoform X1 [Agrilus planipennis]|uniref:Uncharacterized protein LOC108733827 isoform X1 n=1 Tax=Agrilus planipennis TaxID=224129 RepID=A0A7F5RI00_AGRPL|nr:uncharacterized protein LOC108733827 isoform X1 [Agrilus planipennis]
MNRFFTTMYKERGKPYYPENVAKAEHERLLSSTLLVHPLYKKTLPQQINKDPVVVQRIREEKKRLTKNYQLFLDTYHDHFSGKLRKSKNKIIKRSSSPSSPKREKKFNITVNPRNPVQRQGKFLDKYSRKCLQLDLKFVENETPPSETITPHDEQPKSKMHNFVLEELERTNDEIDTFNTQLQAIQGILNDRKVELKFPTNDNIEQVETKEEIIKRSKSRDFLGKTLDRNFRNIRTNELPKMHYKSMADALLSKKKTTSLELLYSNNSYHKKGQSFAKLIDSNSEMNINNDKKITADSALHLRKSSTSNLDDFYKEINSRFPFSKFRSLYKPDMDSVSTPIPKKNNNMMTNVVEKAKSYSHEKSPRTSLKSSPRPAGRYNNRITNTNKNKHLPHKRNTKLNTQITPVDFKGECGDKAEFQKHKRSPRKSPRIAKGNVHYPNGTDCVMKSYIEQKLLPRSPLDASEGRYKFSSQNNSPKSNNKSNYTQSRTTEFEKVLQENVPHGIFGNEQLPKGITNSLFLKNELKQNPSGPPNENHLHNARAVFLRKLQQAQYDAKQQDLFTLSKNNSPYANKKNNSGLYSTFCTALKDTIFEPEKNAV